MTFGLGFRLAVVISAVLLLLVVSAGAWIERQLTYSIFDEQNRQAATHARTMLSSLQTLMLNGQGTLARQWLDRMRGEEGIVDINILRTNGQEAFTDTRTIDKVNHFIGQQRFSRNPVAPRDDSRTSPADFAEALDGKVSFDDSSPGQLTLYVPIISATECLACHGYDTSPNRGVLKLSLSTVFAEKRIAIMHERLWGVAVIMVSILAVILWLALRFSVLRPMARLGHAIVRAGHGDRNVKLRTRRSDEMGDVNQLFNRMQDQLQASELRMRAITDNVVDAIITIDERGIIESINPAVTRIFGYHEEDLLGKNVSVLMPEPYRSQHDGYIQDYLRTGHSRILGQSREITGYRKDGSELPVEIAVSEMLIGDQRRFIGIIRDFTERKQQMDALQYQALHDSLTNLPNRALLLDRLEQAIRTAQRQERPLALLLMDLDRFKEVNDTLGHHNGDLVLQQVGGYLLDVVRSSDTVARLGGDEFAILLPTATVDDAIKVSRKMIARLEAPFDIDGHSFVMGASIGIAVFPEHGDTAAVLMQRADVAMYTAKRGHYGYSIYDTGQDQHSLKSLSLMSELRSAISSDQLRLYYQPVVDFRSGQVSGVEALARWQHPEFGLLQPDDFVPLAEQTGFIRALTIWVLENAIMQSRQWEQDGLELRIAVNLSAHNLHDIHFPERFFEIIDGDDLQLPRLRLEITETAIMSSTTQVLEVLNRLSARGIRISIDDFGTGYSSLMYLKRLPVDEIKIDRSFVTHMTVDDNDTVIVRSTIDLAHNMGLKVVAEGVEDRATYQLLERLHCDSMQGFYVSEPMSADDLVVWLKESAWRIKSQ